MAKDTSTKILQRKSRRAYGCTVQTGGNALRTRAPLAALILHLAVLRMPTLVLTYDVLERLAVRPAELAGRGRLEGDVRRVLEPLLASRGFNVHARVHITATEGGFVLTQ